MDKEEFYEEELYAEEELEEEPVSELEQSHEEGKIDSVELGFSKGYEEDKEVEKGDGDDNEEDPFKEEDFDI